MKRNIILLSISALCLLTSCFKGNQEGDSYNIEYYISGNEHRMVDDDQHVVIPTIFKSDKVLYQLEANSMVQDVTLKNSDVYSCGFYFDDDEILPRPRYWKNNEPVSVNLGCEHAYFTGIVCQGENIFALGNMYVDYDSCGFITKDGQVIFKSETGYVFDRFLIYPSGTIIVAGHDETAGYIWNIYEDNDKKWQSEKGKVTPKGDDYTYMANEVFGYGNSIYISWDRYNAETMECNACYSINNSISSAVFKELSSEESHANSITVFNSNLYIGGYVYRKTMEKTSAMWNNETFTDYGKELNGENYVFKSLYDSNFLHILVINESKMLISLTNSWQAGSFEFAIPAAFEPTGLFIKYTKVSGSSGNMTR